MSSEPAAHPKELILALLTVAAGLANAYLWKGLISAGEFKEVWFYSLPVAALLLFAVLFSVSAAFTRNPAIKYGTAILALAAEYLLIPYQPYVLAAAGLSALGGWYAAGQISSEQSAANAFGARRVLRGGLPIFFTALALVFAVFYFSLVSRDQKHSLLPRAMFDNAVPFLEQPLENITGIKLGGSVDELLIALISKESGGSVDVSRLPPAEREKLLKEARETLASQLGVTFTGREQGNDLWYQVTNAQTEKLLGPYQKYVPFIAAAGFFIAVRAFAIPLYWLTLLSFAIVVKLLAAAGVLKKETVTMQVERIAL